MNARKNGVREVRFNAENWKDGNIAAKVDYRYLDGMYYAFFELPNRARGEVRVYEAEKTLAAIGKGELGGYAEVTVEGVEVAKMVRLKGEATWYASSMDIERQAADPVVVGMKMVMSLV